MNEIDLVDETKSTIKNVQINLNELLELDQFPDKLRNCSSEQAKLTFDLLYKTENFSIINRKGSIGGYTALHWMCNKNEYELIKYLIEKFQADVNCKSDMGETPLLICIRNCNYLTIELLIQNGADLKVRDIYNRSIVHWIAYTGKVVFYLKSVVLYYFQKYHSINNLNDTDKFMQNPLHIACSLGSSELICYLLDSNQVDLYAQDVHGNTCMHLAVKSGLPRSCWLISQKNRGECIRLINIKNKKNQLPIDLIADQNEPEFIKLRDWLDYEAKTNSWLLSRRSNKYFILNSYLRMKLEILFRIIVFPILFTVPILVQYFLFDENYLTVWRGIINYTGLVFSFSYITKQKHRIDHISCLKNPFYLGFFAAIVFHGYLIVYANILNPFDIRRGLDRFCISITILSTIACYKIFTVKTGTKESIKKPDGSPYELHDLMQYNVRENVRQAKDSFNWLIQPGHPSSYTKSTNPIPQAYFCETCLIIQSIPTKHCKLCNECCTKFDHHCVYINGCVGVKNHKHFLFFLITTVVALYGFVYGSICYLIAENEKLKLINADKLPENQITLGYLCMTSRFHVRLTATTILFAFTSTMILVLFLNQIGSISLGYTKFFTAPEYFTKIKKEMKTWRGCILFRLKNLYIFFFKSGHENEKLYLKNQKDYYEIYFNGTSSNNNCNAKLYPGDKKHLSIGKLNLV